MNVIEKRRELWQFAAWLILLFCGITLNSSHYGLSSVPNVIGILLFLFVLAGFVWGIIIYRHGPGLLNTPLDSGLIVVLLVSVVSTLTSIDPSRSWRAIFNWTSIIVVYYIAVTAFRAGWKVKIFVNALLLIIGIFLLFGYFELTIRLYDWFSTPGTNGFPSFGQLRIGGLINNPNTFAVFVNVGLILALGKLAIKRPRPIWIVFWVFLALPIVVFHGSRSGWLALLVSYGCLMVFLAAWRSGGRNIPIETWVRLALVIFIGTTMTVVLIFFVRQSTLQAGSNIGYLYRFTYWQVAIETWFRSPFFGQGPATFASSYLQSVPVPFERLYVNAHSFYMDTLAESGLAGIVAVLFLIGKISWLVWNRLQMGKWTDVTSALLASLIPFIIFSLFDTPWIQQRFLGAIILAALVIELVPLQNNTKNIKISWGRNIAWIWVPIWFIIVVAGVLGWRAAMLHANGIEVANEGNWKEALELLETAQAQLPVDDTSYMLTKAFSEGVLAANDDLYLESAVRSFEKAIEKEPGWSVNHANLAALYWQKGWSADAIDEMHKAIDLAPSVPLYYLNLGLWYEYDGKTEKAKEEFQQLLALDPEAGDGRFWLVNPLRREVWLADQLSRIENRGKIDSIAEIYTTLENDQPNLARDKLSLLLVDDPENLSIQFALGVTQLFLGETDIAKTTWQNVLTIVEPEQYFIPMWLGALPGASSEQTKEILKKYGQQSIFGPGQADKNTYFRDVFVRFSPQAELLPQLQCFSFSSEMMQQLRLLRKWYARNSETEMVSFVNSYLQANENGIRSCFDEERVYHYKM